jgi:hypothetical protein
MKEIINLLEFIPNRDIRNIHFFNGRLLSAEDLRDEQAAQRRHRRQLGLALGEGVVSGLEVNIGSTDSYGLIRTVSVKSGLALNRKGQCLTLAKDISLAMVRKEKETAASADLFAPCDAITFSEVPTGIGVYILVMTPASGFSGSVPRHTLGDDGRASGCGSQYEVEGVAFRLVELDILNASVAAGKIGTEIRSLLKSPAFAQRDKKVISRLRNLLAHFCLGTEEKIRYTVDPFEDKTINRYGAVDGLRPDKEIQYGPDFLQSCQQITACDVPLALILWSKKGVEFVDMWSVRRQLHVPAAVSQPSFPSLTRRSAEAEAAFFQFQDHLEGILGSRVTRSELLGLKAVDYFRYLPAAGLIRVYSFASSHCCAFFKDLTVRQPVFIEGTKVMPIFQHAFSFFPIDLKAKELIWLYLVRENGQAIADPKQRGVQPYVIFTSGQIPFQGDARYDLNYYNYSNYGPFVAD